MDPQLDRRTQLMTNSDLLGWSSETHQTLPPPSTFCGLVSRFRWAERRCSLAVNSICGDRSFRHLWLPIWMLCTKAEKTWRADCSVVADGFNKQRALTQTSLQLRPLWPAAAVQVARQQERPVRPSWIWNGWGHPCSRFHWDWNKPSGTTRPQMTHL